MHRLLIGTAVAVLLGLSPALAAEDSNMTATQPGVSQETSRQAHQPSRQRRHFGRRGRAELGASVVGCGERHQAERGRDEP